MQTETSKTADEQRQDLETAQIIVGLSKDVEYIRSSMEEIKAMIAEIKNGYVTKTEHSLLSDRVKALEANRNWIVTLIVGMVIAAVGALIFT